MFLEPGVYSASTMVGRLAPRVKSVPLLILTAIMSTTAVPRNAPTVCGEFPGQAQLVRAPTTSV